MWELVEEEQQVAINDLECSGTEITLSEVTLATKRLRNKAPVSDNEQAEILKLFEEGQLKLLTTIRKKKFRNLQIAWGMASFHFRSST